MARILSYAINEAYEIQSTITVTIFDEYTDIEKLGKITKIDLSNRKIRLEHEDEYDWIKIDEILLIDTK